MSDQATFHDSTSSQSKPQQANEGVAPCKEQAVLLFYKFHPLSKEKEQVQLYRLALENLCQRLELKGRILVGCNEHQSEGINGTLSGSQAATQAFVAAMSKDSNGLSKDHHKILQDFWVQAEMFYQQAQCPPLVMDPSEFKTSSTSQSQLFPDLNIKLVKELIGTGGVLAPIPLEEVHQGYLTPTEWHERISQMQKDDNDDTILIDCRNTKEWQIGHFPGAPDPLTTTFNQFPTWVQQHSQSLAKKKVLMYCTGGIRCEKASAFIRRQVPSVQEVRHLKGGIHKYLDQYGSDDECLWKGKNFVFDGRGAHGASEAEMSNEKSTVTNGASSSDIVGTCRYCTKPYDVFEAAHVCTVCREPVLVCPSCRTRLREFHCQAHAHLQKCYFSDLSPYTSTQLESQLLELQTIMKEIAVGRKFKQKRKTLTKQCDKIQARLTSLSDGAERIDKETSELKCRNCGQVNCSGNCWGFHGLKRKYVLEQKHQQDEINRKGSESTTAAKARKDNNGQKSASNNAHLQEVKRKEREDAILELKLLRLSSAPSEFRNPETGLRVPPACTRILQTKTKGKWCGRPLSAVLQEEYQELADTSMLKAITQHGLLQVNETKIHSITQAEELRLKNMDVIRRIVHWIEAPVHIPDDRIHVEMVAVPSCVQEAHHLDPVGSLIYACNKPSTVPVHPAGPYLSNTLTLMVEAQEGLEPKSLIPCHRIDRATSGLTICCTNPSLARLIQSRINEGDVEKQYLAKVHGKFPSTKEDLANCKTANLDVAQATWCSARNVVQVDGPIETVDPANGIRKITAQGKKAQSWFQCLQYDPVSNTSIVACTPLTGRSHQLRVHLQYLGHSIVQDTQYDGRPLDCSPPFDKASVIHQLASESKDLSRRLPSITVEESSAAMKVSPCCSEGPEAAFTSAQLLQGGHQICLHAYQYRIPFFSPRKGKAKEDCLATVHLKASVPEWALCLGDTLESLDMITK